MRYLRYLNVLLAAALFGSVGAYFLLTPRLESDVTFLPRLELDTLPKSPFAPYDKGEDLDKPLTLNWVPPQMLLPDLRHEVQFYGFNGRPDVDEEALYLSLRSSEDSAIAYENTPLHLEYQGDSTYTFSENNAPTPLWLIVKIVDDEELLVALHMHDEKGELITTPAAAHTFVLPLQDVPRNRVERWQLGPYHVDSTLLVRQKARWIGPDLFLEIHGGEEYAFAAGKQRIDFHEKETSYSVFVGPDDYLVWKQGRWTLPEPGEETTALPLLAVNRIDEKIMSLELWSPSGTSKTMLSLIRSINRQKAPDLTREFRFVGAKTWAQFIVEVHGGERMILKPGDWLVHTKQGWEKLDTPEQIDAYVDGEVQGPLFVLEKMTKQNGHQALLGHVFTTARSQVEEVALEASSSSLANFYRTIPVEPPIQPKLQGDHP